MGKTQELMKPKPMSYQKEENKEGEVAIRGQADRADAVKRVEDGTVSSVLAQDNGYLKSIIFNLALREIPFTRINYGSGVWRIIKEDRL